MVTIICWLDLENAPQIDVKVSYLLLFFKYTIIYS